MKNLRKKWRGLFVAAGATSVMSGDARAEGWSKPPEPEPEVVLPVKAKPFRHPENEMEAAKFADEIKENIEVAKKQRVAIKQAEDDARRKAERKAERELNKHKDRIPYFIKPKESTENLDEKMRKASEELAALKRGQGSRH